MRRIAFVLQNFYFYFFLCLFSYPARASDLCSYPTKWVYDLETIDDTPIYYSTLLHNLLQQETHIDKSGNIHFKFIKIDNNDAANFDALNNISALAELTELHFTS